MKLNSEKRFLTFALIITYWNTGSFSAAPLLIFEVSEWGVLKKRSIVA